MTNRGFAANVREIEDEGPLVYEQTANGEKLVEK